MKFIAWLYNRSHSTFSECIHSLADTANQVQRNINLAAHTAQSDLV